MPTDLTPETVAAMLEAADRTLAKPRPWMYYDDAHGTPSDHGNPEDVAWAQSNRDEWEAAKERADLARLLLEAWEDAQNWTAIRDLVREIDDKNDLPPIAEEEILPIVLVLLRAAGEPVHRSVGTYKAHRAREDHD